MEIKTLKELMDMGITTVCLRSYGYTEVSCLGNTWQPFGNKARLIEFIIEESFNGVVYVHHRSYWPEDDILETDSFRKEGEKWVSVQDYDLMTRYSIY